jgi:hypothetical protein
MSGLTNITNKILQEIVENIFLEPLAKEGNTLLLRTGSDLIGPPDHLDWSKRERSGLDSQ